MTPKEERRKIEIDKMKEYTQKIIDAKKDKSNEKKILAIIEIITAKDNDTLCHINCKGYSIHCEEWYICQTFNKAITSYPNGERGRCDECYVAEAYFNKMYTEKQVFFAEELTGYKGWNDPLKEKASLKLLYEKGLISFKDFLIQFSELIKGDK